MKRILTVLSLFVIPSLVLAENKIKMVTYFPVPYVAYSKINAQKQLDVGLTSACEMNLGCAESGALGTKPLQVTTANLNRGRLDLNNAAAVKSTNVTLGSGSGEANIDFEKNLRIGTLNNGYSVEANDMTVDELKLFASHMRAGGEKFPSCAATGASGAPQISWQKLKLKNAEEVYLMCGAPLEVKADCSDAVYKQTHKSECCPGVSQSDAVCYKDCSESYYDWGAGPLFNGDFKPGCASYESTRMGYCSGWNNNCFDYRKVITGYDKIVTGTGSSACGVCGSSNAGQTCFVIAPGPSVTCWYDSSYTRVTAANFTGHYDDKQCRQFTVSKRCKNGW